MTSANATEEKESYEQLDFDEIEHQLQSQLDEQMADLESIKKQITQVGNPEVLGKVMLNTVWEQFTNQIAIQAGEDFIKANNGLNLDLRNEAHIQTAENFANGKIARHNTEIDYQKRYDNYQANFVKDANGNIVTHKTRTGEEVATLVKGARDPFDKDRPKGSAENHTDMDHTIPAAEIIRDPEANAYMTKEEQITFANSEANLNEMDSGMNRSKGDKSMGEWLDNPNSNGQKPNEIFDISVEDEEKLRQKDDEARKEYEKQKKEAEKRSIEAGKKSQKAEALRVGKKAARAIIMNLLAELVKKIISKFVTWLKSTEKKLKNLLTYIKDAIIEFVINLKTQVVNVVDTAATVIATSIIGPVVSTIKKAWMFVKQGWASLKQSINYIKNPENKGKPIGILTMEVGKIVMGGITAAGAIVLGDIIEKGLSTIPIFAFEIPLFGSLANIIGMFIGAVVLGIIGALAINLINSLIVRKQKQELVKDKIGKGNEVLSTQETLISVKKQKLEISKVQLGDSIKNRHEEAAEIMRNSLEKIISNNTDSNERELQNINRRLDELTK